MNLPEIKNAIAHLIKNSSCMHCKEKFNEDNVFIIATTNTEGLFEMKCSKCESSTIVTMVLAADRKHRGIDQNDVLDIKNFLRNFDGNFKKLFPNN